MSRTAKWGLVAFLALIGTTRATSAGDDVERMPRNRTLDARFPSAHDYIIEVWFDEKDKPGTFKAKVYDPSIPADYNRQGWEDFRTKIFRCA